MDSVYRHVDPDRLMKSTEIISKDVRLAGTAPELEAMEWLQNQLAKAGWEAKIEHHPAYISLPLNARLIVGDTELPCLTHSFSGSTKESMLEAPLFTASGNGTDDPVGARGKIVVHHGLAWHPVVHTWEHHGAVAQVFIQGEYPHEVQVSPLWGAPTSRNKPNIPHTPLISLAKPEGDRLKELMAQGKTLARIQTAVDTGWREIPQLVANLYGGIPSEDFILFSSHLDSWHQGAMDNGAANATALEVARLMADQRGRLNRNLRLAFWSGHSHGRFAGSAWYVDNHWHELNQHCCAHINVDSTGGMGAEIIEDAPVMAEAEQLVAETIKEITGKSLIGRRLGRFADHSFIGVGITSLLGTFSEQPKGGPNCEDATNDLFGGKASLSGGLGWWWHTAHDTMDKIDRDILTRDTRIFARTVERLLCDPILPFNFVTTSTELRQSLDTVAAWADHRYNLTAAVREADKLTASLRKFYDSDYLKDADGRARKNEIIKKLGRCLIPAIYTEGNRFDFDLCLPKGPLPLFYSTSRQDPPPAGSDEYFETMVEFKRSENQLIDYIGQARELLGD